MVQKTKSSQQTKLDQAGGVISPRSYGPGSTDHIPRVVDAPGPLYRTPNLLNSIIEQLFAPAIRPPVQLPGTAPTRQTNKRLGSMLKETPDG